MAYEVVMPYHLHMPSYFLETFTEYHILRVALRIAEYDTQQGKYSDGNRIV